MSGDHRSSYQFLHLETSLMTEAHYNKGFPGGYKQLKQILFVELEWKKMHQVLPDLDSRASTKSSQLKASSSCKLVMHTVWKRGKLTVSSRQLWWRQQDSWRSEMFDETCYGGLGLGVLVE